jgi:hypothetical protein
MPWTQTDGHFKPGDTNQLGVRCLGQTINLYLNGSKVLSLQDNRLTKGWIGLTADAGIHAVYDNIKVDSNVP